MGKSAEPLDSIEKKLTYESLVSNSNPDSSPISLSKNSELAELYAVQADLLDALSRIENKIAGLSMRMDDIEADGSQVELNEVAPELVSENTDSRQKFTLAEEDFYGQSVDPLWDAEMTMAINDVGFAIGEYSQGATSIAYQECRSGSCRVEFVREESSPPLYPVMFAARGAKRMVFDSITEGGIEKTIVIYQR